MTEALASQVTGDGFYEACRAGRPIVLPVGAFEQHGEHLPLGTDFMIAEALAGALAERAGGLVLPVLPYGAMSRPRSGGGGDLFRLPDLDTIAFFTALRSISRGCFEAGARRLVVVSWHVENAGSLWEAVREAVPAEGSKAIVFDAPWLLISPEVVEALTAGAASAIDWDSDHAGLLETALMRFLRPELVGTVPEPGSSPLAPYDVLPTPASGAPERGVLNDARAVTAEMGGDLFEAMVSGLLGALDDESAA